MSSSLALLPALRGAITPMVVPGLQLLRSYSSSASGTRPAQEGQTGSESTRLTPSKKAYMLKVLSKAPRKLAPQGAGVQMLPPGCSISDPSYSVKDPVYFRDSTEK